MAANWFLIETEYGAFKVGHRKLVYEISSKDMKFKFNELFKDEDVTKGGDLVHTWTNDSLAKYIKMIYEACKYNG
jgi:hypothetical protein